MSPMNGCPVCESNKTKFIFRKDDSNFFRCLNCELLFIWPQPVLEEINQMYQEWGKVCYLDEERIKFDFDTSFEERLDLLGPYRKNNRLLDVGCSTGAFLQAARRRSWDTYGVELSRAAAHYAKDIKELNVFNGVLHDARYQDDYFDVVNVWAVLEHVPNPLEIIVECKRVLRKGGVLVFAIPNCKSLPARVFGKRFRYINKGHLFYFSRNTITVLLDRVGLKIVSISSSYFSIISFWEDLRGITPNTAKTLRQERQLAKEVKTKNYYFIARPLWRFFLFFIRKLFLGEDLSVYAVK